MQQAMLVISANQALLRFITSVLVTVPAGLVSTIAASDLAPGCLTASVFAGVGGGVAMVWLVFDHAVFGGVKRSYSSSWRRR